MAVNTVGWTGRWASWMRNNAYAVHLRKMLLGASIDGAPGSETLRIYRHKNDDLKGLVIDQDGVATGLDIDVDAPSTLKDDETASTADVAGISINVDNAGSGDAVGIDLSALATTDIVLKVPTNSGTTHSTPAGEITVQMGDGTTRYIRLHS